MNVPGSLVLVIGGSHVPVIPLSEVSGKTGGVLYWQSGPIVSNTGMIPVTMVIDMIVSTPHWAGSSGLKVKEKVPVLLVLIVSGTQVPVIPSREAPGKAGGMLNWHSGPIGLNCGVICVTIAISMLVTTPHWPGSSGVKV